MVGGEFAGAGGADDVAGEVGGEVGAVGKGKGGEFAGVAEGDFEVDGVHVCGG